MLIITPSSKEIQIPFEYAGIIPISLATEKRNCVFLSIGNSVIIFRCNLLLFYDGFTDSLDGGQLIVLHDALSILLFGSAIDLM